VNEIFSLNILEETLGILSTLVSQKGFPYSTRAGQLQAPAILIPLETLQRGLENDGAEKANMKASTIHL
jgi:hypothetical protein